MKKQISVRREDVFAQVARRMEWEGTRSPLEKDAYGRVSVSEADRSLLHSLFDEAAMQAIDVCRPFLTSVANTDESLTLNLNLSDSLTQEIADSLAPAMAGMICGSVLAQWMEIVCPDRVGAAMRRQDESRGKVLAILYHHQAPTRRS